MNYNDEFFPVAIANCELNSAQSWFTWFTESIQRYINIAYILIKTIYTAILCYVLWH